MEYEVTVVTLDNDQDYMIIKDIMLDGKRYCYLVNENDEMDICVRRLEKVDGVDTFVYLDSEEELQKVMTKLAQEG